MSASLGVGVHLTARAGPSRPVTAPRRCADPRRGGRARRGPWLLGAAMVVPAASVDASRSDPRPSTVRPPVCRVKSCEGRHPRATVSERPTTVVARTVADGTRMEIRIGPSCRAAWVRARSAPRVPPPIRRPAGPSGPPRSGRHDGDRLAPYDQSSRLSAPRRRPPEPRVLRPDVLVVLRDHPGHNP